MDANRIPRARLVPLAATALLVSAPGVLHEPLRDAPVVWYADDMRTIPEPAERDPHIIRAAIDATLFRPFGRFFHPGRFVRRVGTAFGGDHVPAAANVNVLDEVPNSSWFTNRLGLFPIAPAVAARGPAVGEGPAAPWTVIRPKTIGVTPGFNIRDANGQVWVIKFDVVGFPSMATAAGVISGRILHAVGYNVPDDRVVTFTRDQLQISPDAEIREDDHRRPMTDADLDGLLARVERNPDGSWRALASRFLSGTLVGPFDWRGRRRDDPNDRVNHEDRREIRGLAVFAAWLCHYDTKQGNTLDMYVEEDGRRFIRHYLIDFASTLGAGGTGPFPAACYEYSFDIGASFVRALSLGLFEDPWRQLERPEGLDEIGYYESDIFYPRSFKSLEPNAAFANLTDRDGYWAAKIISAFTDAHLEAVVAQGRYRTPEAARWMRRVLAERRDEIVRYWFSRVPALDFFTYHDGALRFHDLATQRGILDAEGTRYRVRLAFAAPNRDLGPSTAWVELEQPEVQLSVSTIPGNHQPFIAVDVQVTRGTRWSHTVRVFVVVESGRVVALER